VEQGCGLRGIPGGSRPQTWVRRSTSMPRETFRLERCFTPALGRSDREGGRDRGREGGEREGKEEGEEKGGRN